MDLFFRILTSVLTRIFIICIPPIRWFRRVFLRKPFPFTELEVDTGSIHASLGYNPYCDSPPKLSWELRISFKEIQPSSAESPDTTYLSYTVDLGLLDWRLLPGDYTLSSTSGSDLWIDGMDYGPVYLREISIREASNGSYNVTLGLTFNFHEMPFKREKRSLTFQIEYGGVKFSAPLWGEPTEVEFPDSWKVPSAKPHWSDNEVREFVSHHVDLSTCGEVLIDQSGDYTILTAKP